MKQRFLPLTFSVSCGLFCAHSAGAAAPDLLGSASWALLSPPGSAHLNGKPAGMTPVLNVTVTKPASPYYQIQLTHDISAGVPAGTRIRCQFMARSATHSTFHAVIEKRTAPYTHLADQQITLTPAWKAYTLTASVPAAYGPRGMAARLQIGQQAGSFEFKGVTVAAVAR